MSFGSKPAVLLVAVALIASACGSGSTTRASDNEPQATAPDSGEGSKPDSGEGGGEDERTTTDDASTEAESNQPDEGEALTPAIDAPDPIPPTPPEGMHLAWSDEFDGTEINRDNWNFDIGGWGWGNGEAQYYTDRPKNARVENGLLVIELHQEKYEDSYYTSARLLTQGLQEFEYGRIEARIKVPKGAGTWPAFWMLGANFEEDAASPADRWPTVGEIDIMEYVGREPDLTMGTLHGPGYSGAGGLTRWNRHDFEIGDAFHTFAIDWDEEGIRWFFDDEQFYELGPESLNGRQWVFDKPFFVILNLALGGTLGGNIGFDLEFPIQYYVDYVRVYQKDG